MTNLRSFTVTYLPWTHTKGSRISIYDNRHKKRKVISAHSDFDRHEETAAAYLESIGIRITYLSQGKKGFILLSRNFSTLLK